MPWCVPIRRRCTLADGPHISERGGNLRCKTVQRANAVAECRKFFPGIPQPVDVRSPRDGTNTIDWVKQYGFKAATRGA